MESTTAQSSPSVQKMDGESEQPGTIQVIDVLGEGAFGKVMKCVNTETGEIVAVKYLKKSRFRNAVFQRELNMLLAIRELDPDACNIIRFIDTLRFGNTRFFAFEMLDMNVNELIRQRGRKTFALDEIRPMAQQLLVALEALQRIDIMHTDIKPDNIMLVDHQRQPFRVKLIDFGVAFHKHEATLGLEMQPIAYRAPEVMLGLPLTGAVDMWSLGCCIAEWWVGDCPFDGWCYYDKLKRCTQFMGTPDDELLNKAVYATECFVQEGSQWRLKTLEEYQDTPGLFRTMLQSRLDAARDLEDMITNFSLEQTCPDFQDIRAFLDLLKKMFTLDPEKRITPSEALRHPFITMEHLKSAEQAGGLLTCTPTQLDSREDEGIQNYQEQERSSTPGPVNCQPTNRRSATVSVDATVYEYSQDSSGTDSSHPKGKSSKSPETPCATSEEVHYPEPMIYEPSGNQYAVGDITVQNDERTCTSPSKNNNSKSGELSNRASFKDYALASPPSVVQITAIHSNEEKTEAGTSSDTAASHPKRPSVEDTSPCRMVKTKIRVEVQQSGAWKRRTLRITIKT